jgi:hypothetical protein
MNKFLIPVLTVILALGACTMGAMTTEEIGNVQANCSNVDEKIAMLDKEKADNNKRIAAGVGSVFPGTALTRYVTGRYETNVQITTGEWAQHIDAKLVELRKKPGSGLPQQTYR